MKPNRKPHPIHADTLRHCCFYLLAGPEALMENEATEAMLGIVGNYSQSNTIETKR
jgi:hypothetical protein